MYFETNGEIRKIEEKEEIYFYSYDVCDGRREKGLAKANAGRGNPRHRDSDRQSAKTCAFMLYSSVSVSLWLVRRGCQS